ncbi:MAG: YitT family protein, partial [Desulfobacterales bacterium]
KPGPVGSAATAVAASSGSGVRAWRWLWTDLVLIATGSIIFVIGLNTILVQHRLIAGGLAGAAILLNHLQPRLEIGWWYLLLNLPLVWLGWRRVGQRFMLLTIFGMVFFSLAAVGIKPPALAIEDPLLALLAAGVVCGLGAGLVLRSNGSAGGLDVLSVYLKNRFGFSIGSVGFALNALLLAVGVWLYSLEAALYSALFLFVCSRVVDAVMAGVNPPRVMLVISDRADAIGQALLQQNNCRITYLKGEGGFSRGEKKVIYSVAPLMEIPRLKSCVLNEDPEAFVVVNAACEVTERKTFAGMSPYGNAISCQEDR